jgi:hypothetical protein
MARLVTWGRDMGYVLPRLAIIVLAWGITCGLLKSLWPGVDATVFGVVAAAWGIGGTAYFAYLRKLQRDIDELERRHFGAARRAP